jgi:hypothetical protein
MRNTANTQNETSHNDEINTRPLGGAEQLRNGHRALEQKTLDGRILLDQPNRRHIKPRWMFPESICLKNIRSWKKLFGGFKVLRGVTFVTSPSYLLNLFSDYDFEQVDLVVGHGLMDGYRNKLEGEDGTISQLYERVCDFSLNLYGTKATIHTKLYILINDEKTRIINGSPNLSYTAQGSRQREYVWYFDIPHGDSEGFQFRTRIENDLNSHKNEADLVRFMEDLQNLRATSDNDPIEDFHFWSRTTTDEGARAFRSILKEVQGMAFKEEGESEESFRIEIPKVIKQSDRKYLTRNFGAKVENGHATFSRSMVLNEATNLGVPLMKIDESTGEVTIGLGGKKIRLPREVTSKQINRGLADIEEYISLVDRAICHNPEAVKMTMMEAILFTLAAPFANQWLQQKRERVSLSNKRGPRHLVIFGEGHNGKTTFGRFQNHLLSGSPIEPVNGKSYAKKEWGSFFNHIITAGTPYPVSIDDVKKTCFTSAPGSLEEYIKSYFENDWRPELTFPLLMFNTNHDRIDDWAKTRVRRLDFLVKFKDSEKEQMVINNILQRPNNVFSAFAKLYTEELIKDPEFSNDELHLARAILRQLYNLAGRDLPEYFPHRPPEEVYDMDALYCVDRERYEIFRESKISGGLRLKFNAWGSLHNFRSRLPPSVSSIVDDKILIIDNPKEYRTFMKKGRGNSKRGLLSRIFS